MGKQIDNLRRVVQDLELRYGKGDVDVQQLQSELDASEQVKERFAERRPATPHKYNFGSLAKQHFYASKPRDLH
jgi:hypothetical protein